MKNKAIATSIVLVSLLLFSSACSCRENGTNEIEWFPKIDTTILSSTPNIDFIPGLRAYQQTTDYTCGPAVLLSLAGFYGRQDFEQDAKTEMRIAGELGTRDLNSSLPGTKPQEMVDWLLRNGFNASLEFEDRGDGSALRRLQDNIRQGIPTLVEWIDLSGHWAIAVGYDYRNVSDPWDDVLILADPYDRYDDYCDGYSFVNANRFYWMWFDALYFGNTTWRTMITVQPKKEAIAETK
ncbi:MAG TPA: hypothetical protein PKV33_10805 [Methanothrix sp.]|nr:hypothetical protein [Methanothrix sp.]